MKTSGVLNIYIARRYLINMLFFLIAFLFIVYLFDTVELIRRASKRDDIPILLVLQMAFFKLPEAAQVLFPFAVLFSAIFTFRQLTKRYELIVMRAAGFSVWQFLAPVIVVAFGVGIIQTGVINPLSALLLGQFDTLERLHLRHNKDEIALFKEGMWLKQSLGDNQGYAILHAPKISQIDWTFHDVTVLSFDSEDHFTVRMDSKTARLEPNQWVFTDVTAYQNAVQNPMKYKRYELPTTLTITDVEDSFSSPETMSFWRLPTHIKILEETGFDASRLKVHYHNLLAQPLMYIAMILLAATVSMRPPRFQGTIMLIGLGIFTGFIVFFLSSYLQALGTSQKLPPILAAWSPALVCFLTGTTIMMNLEDG